MRDLGTNPLSPPCMTPNPGFHDPSAKSKSLATNQQGPQRTWPEIPSFSANSLQGSGELREDFDHLLFPLRKTKRGPRKSDPRQPPDNRLPLRKIHHHKIIVSVDTLNIIVDYDNYHFRGLIQASAIRHPTDPIDP
jgi:hypothetical protein